jgi:hypothetical protein
MMPGVTFEKIRTPIVDAFTYPELDMVLRERMNVRFDLVVGPGAFDDMVVQLLRWAEQMGREVELIRVTARARPEHAATAHSTDRTQRFILADRLPRSRSRDLALGRSRSRSRP